MKDEHVDTIAKASEESRKLEGGGGREERYPRRVSC
jgi:hypothetical protein